MTVDTKTDIDIDENNLPAPSVTFDPETSIKTIVHYYLDEDDNVVKETREYKVERRLLASQVAERKHWEKFGLSENDPPGGNSANTYPAEWVALQPVNLRQPELEQDRHDEDGQKGRSKVPISLCRFCKGTHFSHKCPHKSDMEAMQHLREKLHGKADASETKKEDVYPMNTSGRYLPPQMRGEGGATIGSVGTEKRQMDGYTVRVTNLPSDTTVDDLKEIFSPFGRVVRVYPAKDKFTQQNRGFAFISYDTASEATSAIYGVNGLRHNHVVLRVDWAKPSAN